MSLYTDRAGAVVLAASITSVVFVIGFQVSAPFMPLMITLVAALFLVFTPALIGIAAVMIPAEAVARSLAPSLASVVVIASNCLLVWLVGLLIPDDLRQRSSVGLPLYMGFAIAGALIWLVCDRFYKRVSSDA